MHELSGASVYHCGQIAKLHEITDAIKAGDIADAKSLLRQERETFGLVIDCGNMIFAAMDRITGYPILLRQSGNQIEITNDVIDWLTPDFKNEFDEDRVDMFLASGYTLGTRCLFDTVRRLLPGEYCHIAKTGTKAVSVEYGRYYIFHPRFLPDPADNSTDEYWEQRLETAFDAAITRTINYADGARIWVPLSAGYDSRAILAKLIALGYDNVEAFSYGNPGNKEALVARDIAEKANVKWRFISSVEKKSATELCSHETQKYMQFAGELSTTPAMTEYVALRKLSRSIDFDEADLIVNGQSGDFLTGGHIPASNLVSELISSIHGKHFSLFTGEHQNIGERKIKQTLCEWSHKFLDMDLEQMEGIDLLAFSLVFEWQERQSHYVIQQHRAYDFLGLRWAVPLWDADLMDLYEEAPLGQQRGQSLYLRYLSKWNYRGMFDYGRLPHDPWPKYGIAFRTMAQIAGVVGGKKVKQSAYRRLYYWTDLNYQYRMFGNRTFNAFNKEMRGAPSLIALEYLAGLRQMLELTPVHPL